jgi:hypothetical protein
MLVGLLVLVWMPACRLPKLLKPNEVLLDANKVKIDKKKLQEPLLLSVKQKPNRKILWLFKFHLNVYRLGSTFKKPNRFSVFLTNKVGEAPAILDTLSCGQTIKQMRQILFNLGYFNATVTYTVKIVLRNATVTYHVNLGTHYIIKKYTKEIADTNIKAIIESIENKSLIKEGMPYQNDLFVNERTRITTELKNRGYYNFTKEFMVFSITDSSSGNLKVKMILNDYSNGTKHEKYTIKNVYVIFDTLTTHITGADTAIHGQIKFIKNGYIINTNQMEKGIDVRPGNFYSQEMVEQTYKNLVQFNIFKFVNIRLENADSIGTELNCIIRLTPQIKQSITWEPQLTLADQPNVNNIINQPYRNYGAANVFKYTNNNLFGQADIFNIRIKNSFELQFLSNSANKLYLSTENSINTSLTLPGLKAPFHLFRNIEKLTHRTIFSASLVFENNRDFNRKVASIGFGYNYNGTKFSLVWMPIELNYINTDNLSSQLGAYLNQPRGQTLKSLFGKNFIPGGRVTMIYNNQNLEKSRHWIFIRYTPIESSGNLVNWLYPLFGGKLPSGDRRIFGVKYFQFVKSDVDFRFNSNWGKRVSTVWRLNAGVGIPFTNSTIIPYEKRYFSGGSIGLRGWRPRTIGPGQFNDPNNPFNRTGEIKLESNVELRFPIFVLFKNYINGAIFADAGNIWNYNADPQFVDAEFKWSRLPKDLAMDAGFGVRIEFAFLMVRLDMALPLRQPGRWIYDKYDTINNGLKYINFNGGIGFPF